MTRRAGIVEIAQRAGVSRQTVSRVLNSPHQVRPETRERVMTVMAEVGYRRNYAARALVTQQSALIGVLWTGAGYFGPSSLVASVEVAARASGYATLVTVLNEQSEAEVDSAFATFRERDVEGIVVVAPHQAMADMVRDRGAGTPVVVVADMPLDAQLHVVAVEQRLGALDAVRHLVAQGARRIAHVSGPLDWFDATERIEGWRLGLREAGLPEPPLLVGDWGPEAGYSIGGAMVASGDLPEAIFAANDLLALGLLSAFHEAGVTVPRDVALVGYDDIEPAGYFSPPLTTVRQPFDEVGVAVVAVLLRAISGEPAQRVALAPTLVVRASSLL
ncbi:MAG: LacI family DNA-binding transcriptional regulator [Arachnia sp.]